MGYADLGVRSLGKSTWNPEPMTHDSPEPRVQTLTLINAEISARLDRQSDLLGRIETKSGLLLGYTIAASSFLSTRNFQPVLGGFAYALFTVAAIAGVYSLAVRNYQDIDPNGLIAYSNQSPARTLAMLIATRGRAFDLNKDRQLRKAQAWWTCLGAVIAGSALMVASILVQTDSHDAANQRGQRPVAVHVAGPASRSAGSAATR
jgi:hypothetical protein